MPISPLLTVFRFLAGTATAMGTGDVFFLLRLGAHFVIVGLLASATAKHQSATCDDVIYVIGSHSCRNQ